MSQSIKNTQASIEIKTPKRATETAHENIVGWPYMNFLNVFLSLGASAMLCVLLGRKCNSAVLVNKLISHFDMQSAQCANHTEDCMRHAWLLLAVRRTAAALQRHRSHIVWCTARHAPSRCRLRSSFPASRRLRRALCKLNTLPTPPAAARCLWAAAAIELSSSRVVRARQSHVKK